MLRFRCVKCVWVGWLVPCGVSFTGGEKQKDSVGNPYCLFFSQAAIYIDVLSSLKSAAPSLWLFSVGCAVSRAYLIAKDKKNK